jgi:hypothetical protein
MLKRLRLFGLAIAIAAAGLWARPAAAATWTNLGGGHINSWVQPVAVVRRDANGNPTAVVDVYVANGDNTMSAAVFDATRFTVSWQSIGCCAYGVSSAIYWLNHREVFIQSGDRIWHNQSNDNATWSGWYWFAIPGNPVTYAAPQAVSWAPGRVDVFVPDENWALNHLWWNGAAWTWENLGWKVNSPVAVANSVNHLDVYGYDNATGGLWDTYYNGNGWYHVNTGIPAPVYLTIAARQDGWVADKSTVFAANNSNGYFYTKSHLSNTNTWNSSGNVYVGPQTQPNAAILAGSGLFVYYLDGGTQTIRRKQWTGTTFVQPANNLTNKTFSSPPAAVNIVNNIPIVFAVDANSNLWVAADSFNGSIQ